MSTQISSPEPGIPPSSGKGRGSGPFGLAWRSLLVGAVVGIALVLGLGVLLAGPLIVGHRQDLPLEKWYGQFAVTAASRLGGGPTTNPLASDSAATSAGRLAYVGSCAACHGAKGDGKGVFGLATYPNATDLTSSDVKGKTDAQLFWITKNGLSFTGMPGFGDQYNDAAIWSIVSYIRALQSGRATTFVVPTPTTDQLVMADISGTPEQRGAAVYYAQGCQYCHGVVGHDAGGLELRGEGPQSADAVRSGRTGMPAYGPGLISDQDLSDLAAYLGTP